VTMDEILQVGIGPTLGFVISVLAGINTVFFRWLIYSFKELRTDIKLQEVAVLAVDKENKLMMKNHEDADQARHEDNLYRFEKIAVALARLGSTNGTHDKQHHSST